jgi:hypothetical protein
MAKASFEINHKEKETAFATKEDLSGTGGRIYGAIQKSKRTIIVWIVCINIVLCISLIVSIKCFFHFK